MFDWIDRRSLLLIMAGLPFGKLPRKVGGEIGVSTHDEPGRVPVPDLPRTPAVLAAFAASARASREEHEFDSPDPDDPSRVWLRMDIFEAPKTFDRCAELEAELTPFGWKRLCNLPYLYIREQERRWQRPWTTRKS